MPSLSLSLSFVRPVRVSILLFLIGIEKGKTYFFIQEGIENWYHPLGFAYAADGALLNNPELEPGIAGPGSTSSCADDLTCPAPQYMLDGVLLGPFNINPNLSEIQGRPIPLTEDVEDFGLDAYEPQFFLPYYAWAEEERGSFAVSLYYPEDDDFDRKNFFFFISPPFPFFKKRNTEY